MILQDSFFQQLGTRTRASDYFMSVRRNSSICTPSALFSWNECSSPTLLRMQKTPRGEVREQREEDKGELGGFQSVPSCSSGHIQAASGPFKCPEKTRSLVELGRGKSSLRHEITLDWHLLAVLYQKNRRLPKERWQLSIIPQAQFHMTLVSRLNPLIKPGIQLECLQFRWYFLLIMCRCTSRFRGDPFDTWSTVKCLCDNPLQAYTLKHTFLVTISR